MPGVVSREFYASSRPRGPGLDGDHCDCRDLEAKGLVPYYVYVAWRIAAFTVLRTTALRSGY